MSARAGAAVVLSALAALLSAGAVAVASAKKPSGIPACTSLSGGAIAKLLGTGPLSLKGHVGNLCSLEGSIAGHYKPVVQIEDVPWSKKLFSLAEEDARKSAASEGATFATVSRSLKVGRAAFFVTGTVSASSKPPCEEGATLPPLGPPACSGQPSWNHFTVIGWGPYKGKGTPLMVSAGATAQVGDVTLSHVIELVKEIISGKIA